MVTYVTTIETRGLVPFLSGAGMTTRKDKRLIMRRTSVRMKRITSTLRMLRSRQRWRLPDLRPAAMFLRMIEKEELMKAGVRRLRRDGESPNVRSRGLPPASPEQAPTLLLRDPPHHAALPLDACPQPAHAHRPRRPRPLQPAVAKRSSCCQAVGQVDEAVGKESSCWQGRAPSAVTMTAATRCTRGSSTRLPSPWRGPTARRTTRCQCPPPRSPWRPVSRLRAATAHARHYRRRGFQLFCSDEGCGAEASPLQPEHQARPPADPEVSQEARPRHPLHPADLGEGSLGAVQ